jgi:hypothetical protein
MVAVQAQSHRLDRVAPFVVDRTSAAKRLGVYLQDQWLAPGEIRRSARPSSLRGVLVPFWAYRAQTTSSYRARVGLYWYRTETTTVMVNGKPQVRTRQVRETEWFTVSGSHVASYRGHLVSGSKGILETEANALEPFDLGSARDFRPDFLAGWIAEWPTVDHEHARVVAQDELTELENHVIRHEFVPGDEVHGVENRTQVKIDQVELVMLPVWIAPYRRGEHVFRLLVNGQTGEVVGAVPRSRVKISLLFAGVASMLLILTWMSGAIG